MADFSTSPRILIAASGSGGHLLPALFIAKAFRARDANSQIEFVGSGRPLEEVIIGRNGFKCHKISAVGLKNRGLKGLLEFIIHLPAGIASTWKLISSFKPDIIVGVGGYVTLLPVVFGFVRRTPVWIHEAELKPGLANAFLSLFATKTSIAFEHAAMPFWANTIYTGHPVRPEIASIGAEPSNVTSPKNILVMGGSQGASAVDLAMLDICPLLAHNSLKIWHQCRKENEEKVISGYKAAALEARVESFIEKPEEAYRWADLIVCRSGAGTVMEIGLINRPTIFVPYPFAQGNHQLANAQTLADVGKALIVEEGPDFTSKLKSALESLLDQQQYLKMKNAPYASRRADAADQIAQECTKLAARRK